MSGAEILSEAELFTACPVMRGHHRCVLLIQNIGALLYTHTFFIVPAEVFQLSIVASHSCTAYQWGSFPT